MVLSGGFRKAHENGARVKVDVYSARASAVVVVNDVVFIALDLSLTSGTVTPVSRGRLADDRAVRLEAIRKTRVTSGRFVLHHSPLRTKIVQ